MTDGRRWYIIWPVVDGRIKSSAPTWETTILRLSFWFLRMSTRPATTSVGTTSKSRKNSVNNLATSVKEFWNQKKNWILNICIHVNSTNYRFYWRMWINKRRRPMLHVHNIRVIRRVAISWQTLIKCHDNNYTSKPW